MTKKELDSLKSWINERVDIWLCDSRIWILSIYGFELEEIIEFRNLHNQIINDYRITNLYKREFCSYVELYENILIPTCLEYIGRWINERICK